MLGRVAMRAIVKKVVRSMVYNAVIAIMKRATETRYSPGEFTALFDPGCLMKRSQA